MQQPQPAVPAEPTKVNAAGTSGVSEHQAKAPMSGNTPSSTIAQPLLASEIRTGASASTTGEEADVLRSFAEAGAPHTDDAIRQLSLQGELRAVSLRIDAITGLPLNVYTEPISEPPTGRFQPPGMTLHLPGADLLLIQAESDQDFEEAESKWEEGQPLYAVWLASSAVIFLSSLFWLQIGFLTGVLGMVGASLMLCRYHRAFQCKLAVIVTATQTLACICMALSASTAVVFVYFFAMIRCDKERHSGQYCFQLNFTLALLVLWHLCHAIGSSFIATHASSVKKMLDPVKSGVMLLRHPGSRTAVLSEHNSA